MEYEIYSEMYSTTSSSIEFQQDLIKEIKTLQEYSKLNNNLLYFSIVSTGLILIYVLMYKFLKIFI